MIHFLTVILPVPSQDLQGIGLCSFPFPLHLLQVTFTVLFPLHFSHFEETSHPVSPVPLQFSHLMVFSPVPRQVEHSFTSCTIFIPLQAGHVHSPNKQNAKTPTITNQGIIHNFFCLGVRVGNSISLFLCVLIAKFSFAYLSVPLSSCRYLYTPHTRCLATFSHPHHIYHKVNNQHIIKLRIKLRIKPRIRLRILAHQFHTFCTGVLVGKSVIFINLLMLRRV